MIFPAKYAMMLRRILLWPFSLVYGCVLLVRHALYDRGVWKSTRPNVPTVAIGNLALGGTGKTPMLELVLHVLKGSAPLATLSRGYGRIGNDIHEVSASDGADRSGDEPVQVKLKHPDVRVYVGADRVKALGRIQQEVPGVKAVVLDDALQHRALDAGLRILLTTANKPYFKDALMPAGNLRDLRARAKTAQVVVVTKCTAPPSASEETNWRERLALRSDQHLFFASMAYGAPRWITGDQPPPSIGPKHSALVFTGIVQPGPLVAHVRSLCGQVQHLAYPDHHPFTQRDLQRLAAVFGSFAAGPKLLITTEKDAARLRSTLVDSPLAGLPLATIGIRTVILNEPDSFAEIILRHVGTHQAHR